jgi:PKD repeat protein
MHPFLRRLILPLALSPWALPLVQAQFHVVTLHGQISPCEPATLGMPVVVQTLPGTLPQQTDTAVVGPNCQYAIDMLVQDTTGGFLVMALCPNGLIMDSVVFQLTPPQPGVLQVDLQCGAAGGCQAFFNVQQATGGGILLPWQITTTNLSTGPAPMTYNWWLPDGSTSTSAEPSFTFNQPGVYGICLTLQAGSCTSVYCDTLTVDSSGNITLGAAVLDCEGVPNGSAMPGSPCDDGDAQTTNDIWQADCSCAGTICQPPLITGMTQDMTLCANDSLVLMVSATGTGPLHYGWAGPGILYSDSLSPYAFGNPVAGIYSVVVWNACGAVDAAVQISVVQPQSAGADTAVSICDISTPTDLLVLLGGNPMAGGTWTYAGTVHNGVFNPNIDGVGMYVYHMVNTAPCGDAFATVNILPTTTWYEDQDGDGLGDPATSITSCTPIPGWVNNGQDGCPMVFGSVGSVCDDGDPLTFNDHLNANCECVGMDSTTVDCLGVPGGSALPGTFCTGMQGGLVFYGNWDANCICQPGTFLDCQGNPGGGALPGTACTDSLGMAGIWNAQCVCIPDTSSPVCEAGFWAIQAYDSTAGGIQPIPNEVWVWNLSSGGNGIYQFTWDFGDGTSSTDAFPTHIYDGPGPWLLCLSMTSGDPANGGCTDTYCDSLGIDGNGILVGLVPDGHGESPVLRSGGFTLNVIQSIPNGIAEIPHLADLNVWPNPVGDMLNISFGSSTAGKVPATVMDPSGRVVLSGNFSVNAGSATIHLPVEKLGQGLYMVRIGQGAGSIAKRFLKVQ